MIKFFLFCSAIAWFVSSHREMKKLQNWVYYKGHKLDELSQTYVVKNTLWVELYLFLTCPFCIGWWTGAIATVVLDPSIWLTIQNGFLAGFIAMCFCTVIEWLNK